MIEGLKEIILYKRSIEENVNLGSDKVEKRISNVDKVFVFVLIVVY